MALLITDRDLKIGRDLVDIYLSKGERIFTTEQPEENREHVEAISDSLVVHGWNRSSAIGARGILLKMENTFDSVDGAIVCINPFSAEGLFHQIPMADLDSGIDVRIRGPLYLIKEILSYFYTNRKRTGMFALVLWSPDLSKSATDAGVAEYFQAFGERLFSDYASKDMICCGFNGIGQDPDRFAEYIENSLSERSRKCNGKWNRFTGKNSLFGFLQK